MSLRLDRLALEHPRLVEGAHALRLAGGAGRVDEGREVIGLDLLADRLDRVGVLREVGVTELGEGLHGDHPVAVGDAVVEGDHLPEVGQILLVRLELLELRPVLGEDDAAVGVTHDVGGVLGSGRRVDGRGRARGTHDREVGEDPLVPGRGRDADALLGLESEAQQTGREASYSIARLGPGDRLPGVASREAERLPGARGRDPIHELDRHVLWHVVEETRVVGDGHDAPHALPRPTGE